MHLVVQVIAYFLCISFLAFVDSGEKYKTKSLIFTILVVLLIFITGFRDGSLVRDYGSYKEIYEQGKFLIEPSFLLLRYIFKDLLNAKIEWLMLFYALLAISVKMIAIKERIDKILVFILDGICL